MADLIPRQPRPLCGIRESTRDHTLSRIPSFPRFRDLSTPSSVLSPRGPFRSAATISTITEEYVPTQSAAPLT